MPKVCKKCNKYPIFSKGLCKSCDKSENPEKYRINRTSTKPSKVRKVSSKPKKATGELELMKDLFYNRAKGRCEITGELLGEFSVWQAAHILSKGAYPRFRLKPENLIIVKPTIHDLYDNSSKEKLLAFEPRASVIYELKDKLRYEYYNS